MSPGRLSSISHHDCPETTTMPPPLDGCPVFADSGVRGLKMTFFPMSLVSGVRTFEGLRPSYSAHVRRSRRTWGTRPGSRALWSEAEGCGEKSRLGIGFAGGGRIVVFAPGRDLSIF